MTSWGGGERKAAWGVSEVQRAGVTASERRGGWRMEEVKEKGRERERTRVNPSTRDITNQSCPPFFFSSALFRSLLSAFLFHSPHGRRNGCCCVFICRPVELLWLSQVTVAGCVWGMSLHGSACPSRRSASVSACLHWTKPCFAVHFKAVVWRFNEVKNITKSLSL